MTTTSASKTEERVESAIRGGGLELDLSGLGLKSVPVLPPQLKRLRRLDLSSNRLENLPDEIYELTYLVDLDLGHNRLSELSPMIGRLANIECLDVSENRLTALPDELCACRNVREMFLSYNKFQTLFSPNIRLDHLIRLDLSNNRLHRLFNVDRALPNIQELDLSNNLFEWIPEGLAKVQGLSILDLSHNQLASVAELSNLALIRELYVDHNRLTEIPDAILVLKKLRIFSARENPFGDLPPQFDSVSAAQLRANAIASVEAHISGGPKPGKQYIDEPPWQFDFLLGVHGVESTIKLADLYYKSGGAGWPATLRLPDGSTMALQDLSRKTAIGVVQKHANSLEGTQAFLDLGNATSERGLKTAFVVNAVSRLAHTELIPKLPGKQVVEFHNESVRQPGSAAAAPPVFPVATEPPPARDINVTAHTHSGDPVSSLKKGETYRIRFQVGFPTPANLAIGNTAVTNVPKGGLTTHWVVTSTDIEFIPALMTCNVQKLGAAWIAEFDLFIPESGPSNTKEVAVAGGGESGQLRVTIYVVLDNRREIYRELTVELAGAPEIVADETLRAPEYTHLRTTHEWTTPPEHIQVSFKDGVVLVSTKRYFLNMYEFNEPNAASVTLLKGGIDNIRSSLEDLREAEKDYFENLDHVDMLARLRDASAWKPYNWLLTDRADQAHNDAFGEVQHSDKWRELASDGYALFDKCFPQGTRIREVFRNLQPGSRVDFYWTASSSNWVSNVPWALMYMEPVDVTGKTLAAPQNFLGLRFRIGTHSWQVHNGSVVLGGMDVAHSIHMLYWGNKPGDDATEAQWQAQEYRKWKQAMLLPDSALPNPKQQLMLALAAPAPSPIAVLYFYCHCSVGSGAQPCLRFGDSSKPEDTIGRNDISMDPLPDAPLVFANACTTAQADPDMTSELEQRFFARGVRAFIGTETKVPIRLASKFAWLYFQFFYRLVDSAPISAGEALMQARMFLWTQYKNVGGLFYRMSNQYDLYLASKEEVLSLRG